MPRFVITGAPGTGKTSVIVHLAEHCATVPEPARPLIAEHRAATGEPTLDNRPELFLRRLVARSIADHRSVGDEDVTFFDRGLPDCVAYAAVSDLDVRPVLEVAEEVSYEPQVFLARPWREIYTTDELRRATFEQVVAFDEELRKAYIGLGYDLIELPRTSAVERAAFITGTLRLT